MAGIGENPALITITRFVHHNRESAGCRQSAGASSRGSAAGLTAPKSTREHEGQGGTQSEKRKRSGFGHRGRGTQVDIAELVNELLEFNLPSSTRMVISNAYFVIMTG